MRPEGSASPCQARRLQGATTDTPGEGLPRQGEGEAGGQVRPPGTGTPGMRCPGLRGVSDSHGDGDGHNVTGPWGPVTPNQQIPAWGCGRNLGSPSCTLSLVASWWCRKYPAIRSPQQREGYKGVFQDQLAEYKELLGDIRTTGRRLRDPEVTMGRWPPPTSRTVGPWAGAVASGIGCDELAGLCGDTG